MTGVQTCALPILLPIGGTSDKVKCEDLVKITIGDDPEKFFQVGSFNPLVIPKKQLPRRPSKEHAKAVREEVAKLKQAGAIKEVFYPEWLANMVVVKKKSGKWRVCINFTDLNKVCSKDPFPMPKIDQLVDITVGHPRMNFLDAF